MSESSCNRRRFLHDTGCFAVTLATLGLLPKELAARPFVPITGRLVGHEKSYAIPDGDSVNIDHDAQLIIVRLENRVFAFNLSCPHQNAAVKWVAADHRFQCTRHDSRYQPDGTYTSGRATRNMDRLGIRREGESVLVDLDHMFMSDKDPAGWAAAVVVL